MLRQKLELNVEGGGGDNLPPPPTLLLETSMRVDASIFSTFYFSFFFVIHQIKILCDLQILEQIIFSKPATVTLFVASIRSSSGK